MIEEEGAIHHSVYSFSLAISIYFLLLTNDVKCSFLCIIGLFNVVGDTVWQKVIIYYALLKINKL